MINLNSSSRKKSGILNLNHDLGLWSGTIETKRRIRKGYIRTSRLRPRRFPDDLQGRFDVHDILDEGVPMHSSYALGGVRMNYLQIRRKQYTCTGINNKLRWKILMAGTDQLRNSYLVLVIQKKIHISLILIFFVSPSTSNLTSSCCSSLYFCFLVFRSTTSVFLFFSGPVK